MWVYIVGGGGGGGGMTVRSRTRLQAKNFHVKVTIFAFEVI